MFVFKYFDSRPTTNESLFEETNYNNLQRWDEEEFLCICTNPPKNAVNGLLNIATCDPSKVYTCHSTAYQLSSKNTIQCSIRHKRHARDVAFDDASDTHSSLDVNYRPNVNNKEVTILKSFCL